MFNYYNVKTYAPRINKNITSILLMLLLICTGCSGSDGNNSPAQPGTDSDGDGIVDVVDICPDQGDNGFGLQPDGCRLSLPVVQRDTSNIALAEIGFNTGLGRSARVDFYRNNAYNAGLSGKYTFMVMEPMDNSGAEAPLWVFLHGGGTGYYNDQGEYLAVNNHTEDSFNHEEGFEKLRKINWLSPVFDDQGNLSIDVNSTLPRRISEGYRILVVSYSDHDSYAGRGTPYPNNPAGGEVNGLQATMAAIDYTVANYPTTHVFAHGTSAGGHGVSALVLGYAAEGIGLTGAVMDSGMITLRGLHLQPLVGQGHQSQPGYQFEEVFEKLATPLDTNDHVEFLVRNDFRATPMLLLGGLNDPAFGAGFPLVPEAQAAGFTSNPEYIIGGFKQAVTEQINSPHEVAFLAGYGHTPSKEDGLPSVTVDSFINAKLATNPAYPFGDPQHLKNRILSKINKPMEIQ